MREIIFDTETTGLDCNEDRVIEIGCVELDNRFPTGRTFHYYINPQGRAIHPDAEAIHGISASHLADKPIFEQIADEFVTFVGDARLVAHNAKFDMDFINAECGRVGLILFPPDRIIDTLDLARRKHPMGPNSLDALCRRYAIDLSRRTKHGALLDAELLAEVYIELIGGKQAALVLETGFEGGGTLEDSTAALAGIRTKKRNGQLPGRLDEKTWAAHYSLCDKIGPDAIWHRFLAGRGA